MHLLEQQSAFVVQGDRLTPQQSSSLPGLQPAGQQPSPSSHAGPVLRQPVPGSQLSAVHGSPLSQLIGSFEQAPSEQLSAVHTSPSSQLIGVPASQFPLPRLHVSAPLQASPSSHSASLPHDTSQSTAQLAVSSPASHVPLPQQNGSPPPPGPHVNPLSEQRESPQSG